MAKIAAWQRVLGAGHDEMNLWELPGRGITVHSGGTGVSSDLSLEDVRTALAEAVGSGLLQLYDQEDPSYPVFGLAEALALIADDDEWDATTAHRRLCLTITPAGESAYHAVFDQYKKSSPFLALGFADPHVIPIEETDASE
jgi:hypothetical protein